MHLDMPHIVPVSLGEILARHVFDLEGRIRADGLYPVDILSGKFAGTGQVLRGTACS